MSSETRKAIRPGRFPPWLKKRLPVGDEAGRVRRLVSELGLATVCSGAHCPNQSECYARGTATFLILGDRCTRSCGFCAVTKGDAGPLRDDEPQAVAEACSRLALRHVVITSVTRDDLADGGAAHFARTIRAVRERLPQAVVEVLVPDFQGSAEAIDAVLAARPDVLNHNVETVPRLYAQVRPEADYRRSLEVLACAKRRGAAQGVYTKSGLMVGLGETDEEVRQVMLDLRAAGCDMLTLGQYLAPSREHLAVARFVPPEPFAQWEADGRAMGFAAVSAGPFVRSSYQAEGVFQRRVEECVMADVDVKLPPLGDDAGDEARVAFWYVDVGENVEEGDDLVQMLTDKATFDVPSPAGGKVAALLADEDQQVKVGQVLCRLVAKG